MVESINRKDKTMIIKGRIRHSQTDKFWNPLEWKEQDNLIVNGGLNTLGNLIKGTQGTAQSIKFGNNNTLITQTMTALPGSLITKNSENYTTTADNTSHELVVFGQFTLSATVGTYIYTTGLFIGGTMFSATNIEQEITSNPYYYIFEWTIQCI
jgi:hypothetical protein